MIQETVLRALGLTLEGLTLEKDFGRAPQTPPPRRCPPRHCPPPRPRPARAHVASFFFWTAVHQPALPPQPRVKAPFKSARAANRAPCDRPSVYKSANRTERGARGGRSFSFFDGPPLRTPTCAHCLGCYGDPTFTHVASGAFPNHMFFVLPTSYFANNAVGCRSNAPKTRRGSRVFPNMQIDKQAPGVYWLWRYIWCPGRTPFSSR